MIVPNTEAQLCVAQLLPKASQRFRGNDKATAEAKYFPLEAFSFPNPPFSLLTGFLGLS
jgi:hypothetical protein